MLALYLVLYVLAAVFFAMAASNRNVGSLNGVALGLLCWVSVSVVQTLVKLL